MDRFHQWFEEGGLARVIVVGGGISGLACAREIADRLPGAEIELLEASEQPGGCVQTRRGDGFVVELGPSGFLNRDPSTLALADRVGLGQDVISGCEAMRRRYILSGGQLRRFPDSPATFATSDLLGLRARARMLLEPIIPRRLDREDETVGQFARRRLGREAAELLVDPVISGIYAGDPEQLSLQATMPGLAAMEQEEQSLLKAFLRGRQGAGETRVSPGTLSTRRYVAFRGGIGQLVDSLADSLGGAIRYGAPVVAIEPQGSKWVVAIGGDVPGERVADVVVSAAPGPAVRRYLGGLNPAIDEACDRVPYAPVVTVAMAYREVDIPHPLTGFGYLVPSREGGSVLGVLWATSIFPGDRAPTGQVVLQAILGGMRDTQIGALDDDTIALRARSQLRRAMGITVSPKAQWIGRHRLGIPQYEVGHIQRVAQVDRALLNHPGLFLLGNAFRGIGINACTAAATRVAQGVEAYVNVLPEVANTMPVSPDSAPAYC